MMKSSQCSYMLTTLRINLGVDYQALGKLSRDVSAS